MTALATEEIPERVTLQQVVDGSIVEVTHLVVTVLYHLSCDKARQLSWRGIVEYIAVGHMQAGVCGTSWKERKTYVVEDVEQFPGHIACSSESKSEIVVPLYKGEEVIGVLDIDSEKLATFDAIDKEWLEQIAEVVASKL